MVAPTLTYALANGNTADATQVMQNYNDLLNGITDGTKDLAFNKGTMNGIVIAKAGLYMPALNADPAANGGTAQYADGTIRSVGSWIYDNALWKKILPYAITSGVSFTIDSSPVTLGASTVTMTAVATVVTLPVAANSLDRIITIKKYVSGNGTVTIKGAAAGETIEGVSGTTGITLDFFNESVTLQCNGAVWFVKDWFIPNTIYDVHAIVTGNNTYVSNVAFARITKHSPQAPVWILDIHGNGTCASTTNQTVTVGMGVNFSYATALTGSDFINTTALKYATTNSGATTFSLVFTTATTSYNWNIATAILSGKPNFVI